MTRPSPATIRPLAPPPFLVKPRRLRLLGLVFVIGPGVRLEAFEHLAAKRVVLEHAAHGFPQRLLRTARQLLLEGAATEPPGMTRVALVGLGLALVARDMNTLGVDHHDEVAGVEVGRVARLVAAPEG